MTTTNGPWTKGAGGMAGAGPVGGSVGGSVGGAERPIYAGSRGAVFRLAFLRSFLTVVTLGLARFWMTTRLRRHYWSSVRVGGQPLEYSGTALELFIGFLMAVVILAGYLAVVNIGLGFIGLSYFQGNPAALQLPLLALLPLGFWARYRAIRYLLARTRWRGLRFGLSAGAWGYTARGIGWGLVTVATLGLLYPLMQMRLSRFVTARVVYGDLTAAQTARFWPLFRAWMWLWPVALIALAGVGWLGYGHVRLIESGAAPEAVEASAGPLVLASFAAVFGVGIAYLRYRVFTFRHLHSGKVLGGATRADVELGAWRVFGVLFAGLIVIALAVALLVAVVAAATIWALAGAAPLGDGGITEDVVRRVLSSTGIGAIAVMALTYLTAIALVGALGQAFITMPLLRAALHRTKIHGLDAAARARQRDHDPQTEAGGFADALGAGVGPV